MNNGSKEASSARLWQRAPRHARHVHVKGSYFDWIEGIQEPEFEEIRARIESLWLKIPESPLRAEFKARLRSKECTNFLSAYNELWYREALESGGLCCLPPQATKTESLPDWCLTDGTRLVSIAECYLRTEPEKEVHDDFVQHQWFHTTYCLLENKSIRLWVHSRTTGKLQPSAHRLARTLDGLARTSSVEEDHGSVQYLGRYRYEDQESGWSLDFTLIIRRATSVPSISQLTYAQDSEAYWCQGKELLDEALSYKSRQHASALPVVICIGWNYFKHEHDLDEARHVIAIEASSLERRGVCGVFWARAVYPWNPAPAAPRLLHWQSELVMPLLACWNGAAVNVAI